jgi:hypothetical protein
MLRHDAEARDVKSTAQTTVQDQPRAVHAVFTVG